jgi:hypothetical protein
MAHAKEKKQKCENILLEGHIPWDFPTEFHGIPWDSQTSALFIDFPLGISRDNQKYR